MNKAGNDPTYYLFRSEYLDWFVDIRSLPKTVTQVGRRQWRVNEGDILVFTEGRGLELMFIGQLPVIGVEASKTEKGGRELIAVTVTLGQPTLFPEGTLFSRFMYSLTAIANLARPWLHIRHKTRISHNDVETLMSGRIAWDRTIYFGLLRDLPPRWRRLLEAQSRALRAAKPDHEQDLYKAQPEPEPVPELLKLIESTLVLPVRLGADVYAAWLESLGSDSLREIEVVDPEGQKESWDFQLVLSTSSGICPRIDAGWKMITQLPLTALEGDKVLRWRPHRW